MLLGDLLVQRGFLTQRHLKEALEEQKTTKEFLGALLVRRGFLKEEKLIQVISEQFNIPFVELSREYIDWEVALSFPSTLVVDHEFLPLRREAKGVIVAVTNPLDAAATSEIEKIAGFEKVHRVLVTSEEMSKYIKTYKQKLSEKIKKLFDR